MDLSRAVMNELRMANLQGAIVTGITVLANDTRISFVIEGIEVHFVARNETVYSITSVVHHGQVFEDAELLNQYDAWVRYIASVVFPMMKAKKRQKENKTLRTEVANKSNTRGLLPDERAAFKEAEKRGSYRSSAIKHTTETAGKADVIALTQATEKLKTEMEDRIKEAESRGRKEGFKAARRRHLREMKNLKRKYHALIFLIILVITVAFAVFWYLNG
ncbi:MAG: hypothetical protein FWE07_03645 [Turicibacter sp.]|nr:hypothetical protein [Turicibacter sp.]